MAWRRWGQVGFLMLAGERVEVVAEYRDDEAGQLRYRPLPTSVFLEPGESAQPVPLETAPLANFQPDERFRPLWPEAAQDGGGGDTAPNGKRQSSA